MRTARSCKIGHEEPEAEQLDAPQLALAVVRRRSRRPSARPPTRSVGCCTYAGQVQAGCAAAQARMDSRSATEPDHGNASAPRCDAFAKPRIAAEHLVAALSGDDRRRAPGDLRREEQIASCRRRPCRETRARIRRPRARRRARPGPSTTVCGVRVPNACAAISALAARPSTAEDALGRKSSALSR